jgi:hypothetical protein
MKDVGKPASLVGVLLRAFIEGPLSNNRQHSEKQKQLAHIKLTRPTKASSSQVVNSQQTRSTQLRRIMETKKVSNQPL